MQVKLALTLALAAQVSAWWCTGHMIVAEVAQMDLQENDPLALEWAQGLVENLAGVLTHGTSDTFVESACWPDDIKSYGLNSMNDWHFIDQPYNPDGMANIIEYSNGNALWAIDQFTETLTDRNRAQSPLETSIAMRYMIHVIGDIHQPLHVAAMWSAEYPNGDLGGNLFPIEFDSQVTELHALWDSCLGHYEDNLVRPLNQTSANFLEGEARNLVIMYPRSSFAAELSNPIVSDWALANYHLAVTYSYNITSASRPSQYYLDVGWAVVQKQLVLAGYRLSTIIQQAYTSSLAFSG